MGEIYGCPILLVQFFSREKIGTPSSQPSCLWEKFMKKIGHPFFSAGIFMAVQFFVQFFSLSSAILAANKK